VNWQQFGRLPKSVRIIELVGSMSNSRSLVPLQAVPSWQPVRRKRSRALKFVVLAFTLTGVAVLGAGMLRSGPAAEPRASNDLPKIGIAPVMFAEPGAATQLSIHVTPPGAAGDGFIQINGLPLLASLSEGHATRPGSWAVPVAKLATLKIVSPPGAEDPPQGLAVVLFSHEGIALSEARALLTMRPAERLAPQPAGAPSAAPAQAAVGDDAEEAPRPGGSGL
jgi:hypothetical protein